MSPRRGASRSPVAVAGGQRVDFFVARRVDFFTAGLRAGDLRVLVLAVALLALDFFVAFFMAFFVARPVLLRVAFFAAAFFAGLRLVLRAGVFFVAFFAALLRGADFRAVVLRVAFFAAVLRVAFLAVLLRAVVLRALPVDFFAVDFLVDFFVALRAPDFRPEPDCLPPPSCLLTVAQAMRSAASSLRPRSFSLSSMCPAWRFCLSV